MMTCQQTCQLKGCTHLSWAPFYQASPICSDCYRIEHDATYDEIIVLTPRQTTNCVRGEIITVDHVQSVNI